MEERLKALSSFSQGLSDIRISRHPGHKDMMFIIMNKYNDQYGDAYTEEVVRIYKQGILQLKPQLDFVQEFEDVLSESDEDPYSLIVTTTNLPRFPRTNDRVLIDGELYEISAVRPTNRNTQRVFECLVYPDRNATDELDIKTVNLFRDNKQVPLEDCFHSTVNYEIIYGGSPIQLSFNNVDWFDFTIIGKVYIEECLRLWLKNASGEVVKFQIGHVD